ncbi:cobyrinate a,c-diamide synthase [Sporolituus thermophilus]|uniref:Cobyrinate a,c-diamide synthase n=1 Tax=Sporolituus thermophilus DSM 23256 TaxID=1123285 RepID=A0A1G7I4T4_9FIRM|nr:cobyrinate a,c-diamide synthase [Sporolituus thermophilus]SDF07725.1 cobyrinic acid a,c-diamide synthase [Sporolituus thermophilus DSM 23256]
MTCFQIPRLVIAGTHSGVGKTTIVTGLLAALARRGLNVQSYKVGPDYIDPGYHALASGKRAHNLDTWLMPPEEMVRLFVKTASGCELALIEGVMGLYDGGRGGVSSTAVIAKRLDAPVILVIDAKSMGESAAAIALGYKLYDQDIRLAGVIVNRLGSETHRTMVAEAFSRLGIPLLGAVFRDNRLSTPQRHLGLTPVTEHDARKTVDVMADRMAEQVAVDELISLAKQAPPLVAPLDNSRCDRGHVRIGVAKDEAFSFYYPESLDVLTAQGAELVEFSPLYDQFLPPVDGLVLGGGFPEMFLERLTANRPMREAIFRAGKDGMPIYAECGGLMYLCRQISGFGGQAYDMVGLIPAVCEMQSNLQTVGYVETRALHDTVLCLVGEKLRGHEFHFSRMVPDDYTDFPWAFEFTKVRTGAAYRGGFATDNILASYLHIHFAGNKQAAGRFVEQCIKFRGRDRHER